MFFVWMPAPHDGDSRLKRENVLIFSEQGKTN